MIIIGEKINGSIPSTKDAIERKDADFIRNLAVKQTDAGAHYLDICAGTRPDVELETLRWLVEIVQDAVPTPLCIDSPDPDIIASIYPIVSKPGIINSVSGEGNKCDILYELAAKSEWKIIALTCDDTGIPAAADKKVEIGSRLIEKAGEYGIAHERLLIDPLVLSLAAVNDSLLNFLEAIRQLKAIYPGVGFTSGLSNISFGMPKRKYVNRNFLVLALAAGMDSAIMDPTNDDMFATILAAEVLLGRDKYCRSYNTAFRKGRLV